MFMRTRFWLSAGLILAVIAAGATLVLPPSLLRLGATILLVCILPGWAVVEALFASQADSPNVLERLVAGMGISFVITVYGGWELYFWAGQLTQIAFLALYLLFCLLGFGWAIYKNKSNINRPDFNLTWLILPLILILGAYYRFYYLSFSDYRGDEAEIIMRAITAIRGEGQPLLSHTKGPTDILLIAATGLLYGAYNELAMRLPFSVGNMLIVVSTYLLTRRVFNNKVALIATALAAINGWYVTYARIALYQGIVLPMMILGVWGYYRFYQTKAHRFHFLGTLYLSVAVIAHYEGVSAVPPALFLLILTLKGIWESQNKRLRLQNLWPVGLSLAVGGFLSLSFYIPYILNPALKETRRYLGTHLGTALPYNNWDHFYVNGLFFNSIYYIVGLGIIVFCGTLWGIAKALGGGKKGFITALVAIPVLLLSWTGLLHPLYAVVVYTALMALLLLSPYIRVPLKTMLIWMVLPMAVYLFASSNPGDHYYAFMPPLVILAAYTIYRGLNWLLQTKPPLNRWAWASAIALLLILFGLSAWYEQLLFMQTKTQYILNYPRSKNPIFFSDPRFPFSQRIGRGYPFRLGWQSIGELYRSGELKGDWYSTDEGNSLIWYTLGEPQNPCFPTYFMLPEIGYEVPPLEVPMETIEQYYTHRATVEVYGVPRLRLYQFDPEGSWQEEPVTLQEPTKFATLHTLNKYSGDHIGAVYRPQNRLSPPQRFKPHPDVLQELAQVYNDPNTVIFDEAISLLGYDLDLSRATPGGVILLTLYWQADSAVFLPYKVFTHLSGPNGLVAQADSEPACGYKPTYNWRSGDQIIDRHAIFLPAEMTPGDYELEVGLYELRSGLRMDKLDEAGNPAGNWLNLPPINVRHKE